MHVYVHVYVYVHVCVHMIKLMMSFEYAHLACTGTELHDHRFEPLIVKIANLLD